MTARETLALLRLAIPLLWAKQTEEAGRTSRTPPRRKTPHDTPKTATSTTRSDTRPRAQKAHHTEGTRPKKPAKQGGHR